MTGHPQPRGSEQGAQIARAVRRHMYMCMYIYIYIHVYIYIYTHIYIYIYLSSLSLLLLLVVVVVSVEQSLQTENRGTLSSRECLGHHRKGAPGLGHVVLSD